MKTPNRLILGGVPLLASGTQSGALPPRQHSVSGVITDIDHDARTITLAPSKGDESLVFDWKDSTQFSQGWSRICLGTMQPGQWVKIYYRRAIVELIPREVSLRTETRTHCPTGDVRANKAN